MMYNPTEIFLRPRRWAEEIRIRPRVGVQAAVMVAASMGVFAAGYFDAVSAAAAHLPGSASPVERAAAAEVLKGEFLRNLSFFPIRLLLGWGLFALALFISARMFCAPRGVRFAHFLSLEIGAEAILLIGPLCALVHLQLPSLALLDPGGSPALTSLLTSINLITLWYFLALSAGISVLCGSRIRTAALAAGVVWAGWIALNSGILALLSREYTFPQ